MCILFFSKWRKTVERILIPFLKNCAGRTPRAHMRRRKKSKSGSKMQMKSRRRIRRRRMALCKHCGEKVELLAGNELVRLVVICHIQLKRKEGGRRVGQVYKKRLGLCCVFPFFPILFLRKPAVLWRHYETLKSVQERPVPSSYSDVVVVEQQVKDDTCEGNWASVHAASQPCDPQWGAFPWCGAQTLGLHGSSYQWWMTVSVLLLIKNGY